MRKVLLPIGGIALALLLVGAGCAKVEAPKTSDSSKDKPAVTEKADVPPVETNSKKITLSATPIELAGQVYLQWAVPEQFKSDEGYRLVRSKNENPTFPGNFWFHQEADRDHITWIDIPGGTWHFRICQFVDGACAAYSDDVSVIVPMSSIEAKTSTPENVVKAFYEALIENREDALQYVPLSIQNSDRFKRKWEQTKDWQYMNVKIGEPREDVDGGYFVDVHIGIRIGDSDRTEQGKDQVSVEKRGKKWWVTSFPT